jgi:hypothetical protein
MGRITELKEELEHMRRMRDTLLGDRNAGRQLESDVRRALRAEFDEASTVALARLRMGQLDSEIARWHRVTDERDALQRELDAIRGKWAPEGWQWKGCAVGQWVYYWGDLPDSYMKIGRCLRYVVYDGRERGPHEPLNRVTEGRATSYTGEHGAFELCMSAAARVGLLEG